MQSRQLCRYCDSYQVVVVVVVKFFNKNFVTRKVDNANIQTETDIKQSKQVWIVSLKAQTPLVRIVVDCCGLFVVQFVVQQIRNKSNKFSLSLAQQVVNFDCFSNSVLPFFLGSLTAVVG